MRQANEVEIKELPFHDPRLLFFFVQEADKEYVDFMLVAKEKMSESTDQRHPTSAVVVKDGKIIAMDTNQTGYKYKILIKWHQTWFCIRHWFKIRSGTHYWLCPGCAKSRDHAESRVARKTVERCGDKAMGATLYLYGHWWCCKPCCDAMVKAGITRVVLLEGAKDSFLGTNEKHRVL